MPEKQSDEVTLQLILQRLDLLIDHVEKRDQDYEQRLRDLEARTTRLAERLTGWNIFQAVYTSLAAIFAGMFGKTP